MAYSCEGKKGSGRQQLQASQFVIRSSSFYVSTRSELLGGSAELLKVRLIWA
jgi:hypothetical protein